MTEPLMLIDGASLWYRAFHALPEKITAPDGSPVNAVRGFTDMVSALIRRERPARLVVCLDRAWRPQFRVDAVPSYKAHRAVAGEPAREDAPEALPPQVPSILALLRAAGVAVAGADGCEADDVIGTLAHREATDPVVVVSGDRDLLQVVRDAPTPVRVLYVGRGIAKAEDFGPREVAARYGVPAHRAGAAYAELALLRGDPSDGLPGVAGIGEKTAGRLLTEYGDVGALRAAAADPGSTLTPRVRRNLAGAAEYLDAALPVVRVLTDAPVEFDGGPGDVLPRTPVDATALEELAGRLGVGSVVERLVSALADR
ncbi:5'-3' exonuclease [Tomitella gaofuii]|uniref:5'-3' exonuclease n=1 Tax=Tomitella gaofuii TaxID=2760083 RepID=UPI0015FE610D|nr:5'-3' exonuclease [Tomitella gaofuii]